MRVVYEYSHLGGGEILQVRHPEINAAIYEVIAEVKAERTKESEERSKKGKMLYAPKPMNAQFKVGFQRKGLREMRDTYTITIPAARPR